MSPITFFKLQAKNLFKDYKTQFVYQIDEDGTQHYTYKPKYFNMDWIFLDFEDFDEENFSLMKAQHLLAIMLGFKSWAALLNAKAAALELAKLRFDNQHKISFEEWDIHIEDLKHEHDIVFDDETMLEFFKHGLQHNEGQGFPECDYRLTAKHARSIASLKQATKVKPKPEIQITSLPLNEKDREEFIETANSVFETVMWRTEPRNPELTRKLWNAEDYIDNTLLSEDMLPISRDYALSLIDAFLVQHVLELAVEADKAAEQH